MYLSSHYCHLLLKCVVIKTFVALGEKNVSKNRYIAARGLRESWKSKT